MLILTIRTDKPEAELGLYENEKKLSYKIWPAHRQLAETIHKKVLELLKQSSKDWNDITGIICFEGPGSFTGLRIGLTVGNTIAMGADTPIVACGGDEWIQQGLQRLQNGENDMIVRPKYGSEAHITQQKK